MGRPARAFMTGLMVLAGLILLAACANLGSLFAARAADRARELALRMALGSTRGRIMRQLFTEALLISAMGGAVGLWGSMMLLESLRTWEPVPRFPLSLPVNPDARVYGVALLLTIVSGFLFGAVPVKQVLRTDPYEIVKSGSMRSPGRRITVRDALLCVQIALCALLVTSSMVALRGLIRSLHSDFGFDPRGALLMDTVLDMAGYHGDQVPVMEKRMMDAMGAIPGVTSVGMIDWLPMANGSWHDSDIFTDETSDLKPANAALAPVMFNVSPGYFEAARTTVLSGRTFTWNDDKNAPRVAVINEEFARRIFGSASKALGRHYKMPDGARIEVVGVAENGKYKNLTEDPQTAMFFPLLQVPSSQTSLIVRSDRDPQQLAEAMRSTLRNLDAGLPSDVQPWQQVLDLPLFPARMATASLGVLGAMGAMLSVTGIFGLAAYSVSKRKRELGIRMALGAQRKEVLEAALGRAFKLLALGSAAGLVLGLLASKVLSVIVYQATPRGSAGAGGRSARDAGAWLGGNVDSGATGAVAGSGDVNARGVICRLWRNEFGFRCAVASSGFENALTRDDASFATVVPSYLRGHRGAVFRSGGDRLSQGIEAARVRRERFCGVDGGACRKRCDSGGDEIATGERGGRNADSVFGRDGVAHCAAARGRHRFLELGFAGCGCGSDGICRDVWD